MDWEVERICLARRGDRRAFGELVRAWQSRVLACCRSHLSVEADADDAVQETFVRAHQQLNRLDDPHRFGGWLRGIARHVCLDLLRRQRRAVRLLAKAASEAPPERLGDPADAALQREERIKLLRTIDQLPAPLREVVLLRYFEEMSYDTMANWLGVSRATVTSRLRKGRELLRSRMQVSHPGGRQVSPVRPVGDVR